MSRSDSSSRTAIDVTIGSKVRDRRDHHRQGIVVGISATGALQVFYGQGDEPWVEFRHVEPVPAFSIRNIDGESLLKELAIVKARLHHSDQLFSFGASLTEFAPYQFRPVIKFLNAWHDGTAKGLLIADEVGLGKTIEAAIIMQELKARKRLDRVLVLCPSKLTQKWREELLSRFNEDFTVWSADSVRELIRMAELGGEVRPFRAIASLEMLRSSDLLEALQSERLRIDYLIIDESHHLRNPETRSFKLGNTLAERSESVVLLSATPVHLHNDNLRTLLRLISPEQFEDPHRFADLMEPNQHINAAVSAARAGNRQHTIHHLQHVEHTALRRSFTNNPWYNELLEELTASSDSFTPHEKADFQRRIHDLNTLSSVVSRTRKREFKDVAQRDAVSIEVTLTPDERALYDSTLQHIRRELIREHDKVVGFSIVMRERQAASCLPAMKNFLQKALRNRPEDYIETSEFDLDHELPDTLPLWSPTPNQKTPTLEELVERASNLQHDTKLEHLLHHLQNVFREGPGRKILLFAYFRETLEYLQRELDKQGIKAALIHGGVETRKRQSIIEQFRTTNQANVLLSSEVGAEGLDFEFCDVLVNYDLPWNPMAVEQRIGRLDRFNRSRDKKIRILNFFIKDTIETRIFQRLYERINIFRHSIGDLEDILGDVVSHIRDDMLLPELTEAQWEQRAQQQIDRIANIERENAEFEKAEQSLLGHTDILDAQVTHAIKSGKTITGEEVSQLVGSMLQARYGEHAYENDPEDHSACLSFSQRFGEDLDDFCSRNGQHLPANSVLSAARVARRSCPLVFNASTAQHRPNAEFVTIHHPLARMALEWWEDRAEPDKLPVAHIQIDEPTIAPDSAWYFIYRVRISSIQERERLEVVVMRDSDQQNIPEIEEDFLSRIQHRRFQNVTARVSDTDVATWASATDKAMESRRETIDVQEQDAFDARVSASIASLEASRDTEVAYLTKLMDNVSDERIRRMRRSEINNKQRDYDRRITELRDKVGVVVEYQQIAGGKLFVNSGTSV